MKTYIQTNKFYMNDIATGLSAKRDLFNNENKYENRTIRSRIMNGHTYQGKK